MNSENPIQKAGFERATSPVVGVVLLFVMTVVLATVIGTAIV
ncbi:type IV pilin N-terminal domain-containing protein [Natronomonas sp. F2-12]|jgi:flagellin-like protein|uniref:Type IV pilin N-terminal domain-containing protein n=1 Tax=Natronomonas aquatica TaxID=2841590 RepID=A0A9R1CV28_9EURY|nr:type IV pilin N-terminal domain-containing protein [Natronomonas aquatica]MCQ4334164.1 type IV pilin N-terminal domain-containing protein [Natronomonas aquatica]